MKFEMFIYICIVLSIVVLGCNWYMMDTDLEEALDIANNVFTGIFTLEALIKIITWGKLYFKDGWNIFDFCVVISTYFQIGLNYAFSVDMGTWALVLRIFRMGRILRLVRKAQSLRDMFNTFIRTIPSLANIGLLLFLLIYIYSLIGITLFGRVKL
jgi:hypothetical protein